MGTKHRTGRVILAIFLPGLLIASASFSLLHAQETILVFPPNVSSFPEITTWFFPFDSEGNFPEDIVAADFELLEAGIVVEPDFIECPEQSDPVPIAATLAIDVSGSMGTRILNRTILSIVTDAVGTFVRGLDMTSSTASLLTFNTKSRVLVPFTNDTTRILDELERLLFGEGTDFREAFLGPAGAIPVARTGVQKRVVVMFTDGEGLNGDADEIIRRAKEEGITIYIVVVGAYPWKMLEKIALETGGLYFQAYREPEQLDKLARLILDHARRSAPCRVVWQGRPDCSRDRRVVLRLDQPAIWGETRYKVPDVPMPELLPSRNGVLFGVRPQGSDTTVSIELAAVNGPVTLTGISGSGPNFSVVEVDNDPAFLPTTIFPGSPLILSLRYYGSEDRIDERIVLLSSACEADTIYCTAGNQIERGEIPIISIARPNGGEVYGVDTDGLVSFTGGNPTFPYSVDYTTDGGLSWIPIGETTIPSPLPVRFAEEPSDSCLARVSQTLNVDESRLFARRSRVIDQEFTHSGNELVTLGDDWVVRRWLVPSGALLGEIRIGVPAERILPIAGTPSFGVEYNGSLSIYSTVTGSYETFPGLRFNDTAFTTPIPVTNRDRRIVSHPDDPILYGISFHPALSGEPVAAIYRRNLEIGDYLVIDSLGCLPRSVAISDDGRFLAIGGVGGCLEVRRDGFRDLQFKTSFINGDIVELAFDPSGLYLAVLFENEQRGAFDVSILRSTDGMVVATLPEVSNSVRTIDFLSTVDTLLIGEMRPTLRSTWSGSVYKRLDRGEPGSYGAARSPSSRFISTTTPTGEVQLWELGVPFELQDLSDSLWRLVPPDVRMIDVDFGQRLIGSRTDSTLRPLITNWGSLPVRIDSLRIIGPEEEDFAIESSVQDIVIPPSGFLDVDLTFIPGGSGNRIATLVFEVEGAIVSASLAGVGLAPSLSLVGLAGESLDFGCLPIGVGRDSVVLVRNTGSVPLQIDSITIDGPNGLEFMVDDSEMPITLDPFEETTLDVRFVPTALGLRTTGCSIWYSDSDQGGSGEEAPVLFRMTGTGLPYERSVVFISDSLIRLSSTCLESDSVSIAIMNPGTSDVIVAAPILQAGSPFTIDETDFPLSIPTLESRSLMIRFSPETTGLWIEEIEFVYSGATIDSVSINVEGSASEDPADIALKLVTVDTLLCAGDDLLLDLEIGSREDLPEVVKVVLRFDRGSGIVSGPAGGFITIPPGEVVSTRYSIDLEDGVDTISGYLLLSGFSCLDVIEMPFAAVRRHPDVRITEVDSVCRGGPVSLQVVGEGEVRWETHPDIGCSDCPVQEIFPSKSGWYRMEFTDVEGCSTIDSVEVIVSDPARGELSFAPILAVAVNDTFAIPIVYRQLEGEGVVTDELSISIRFDPGVLLPEIDAEGIFVGTPLADWRVDRIERSMGEVTWHLRGDPISLEDDLMLMRLVGRVFIGGSRGTDLQASLRLPVGCFSIDDATWWLDVDSICGLENRLIEIGFGRWDPLRVVPNPVLRGSVSVSFEVPWDTDVELDVLDLNGRRVTELLHGPIQAGVRTEVWEATKISSGQYFIRLRAGNLSSILPVMLVE